MGLTWLFYYTIVYESRVKFVFLKCSANWLPLVTSKAALRFNKVVDPLCNCYYWSTQNNMYNQKLLYRHIPWGLSWQYLLFNWPVHHELHTLVHGHHLSWVEEKPSKMRLECRWAGFVARKKTRTHAHIPTTTFVTIGLILQEWTERLDRQTRKSLNWSDVSKGSTQGPANLEHNSAS